MSPRVFGVRERRDLPAPRCEPADDDYMRMRRVVTAAAIGYRWQKVGSFMPWHTRAVRWVVNLFRRPAKLPMLPKATTLIDKLGNRR